METMILGFLAEGPRHGYELRRKMSQLHGYARPISEGAVYPAITRLLAAGYVRAVSEPGTRAASRRTLHLTDEGLAALQSRLRSAEGHDITDQSRYFIVLAFLSHLPDPGERRAVLERRRAFLESAEGFFLEGDEPMRSRDMHDPYRRGILQVARATRRAELSWLAEEMTEDRP